MIQTTLFFPSIQAKKLNIFAILSYDCVVILTRP